VSKAFQLGTFSAGSSQPFAGLVLKDAGLEDRVIAVRALEGLCSRLGHKLKGAETMLGLLEDWSRNLLALEAAVNAIQNDSSLDLPFVSVSGLQTLPPVNLPRQIFCSGANYKKHVIDIIVAQGGPHLEGMSSEERRAWGVKRMDDRAANGKPFVFTKLPSSIIGPFETVELPPEIKQPDWELELGVIIGKPARRVKQENALEHIAGYTVINDITARELVYRADMPEMGMDWLASKSAPGFLPMGPYLTPTAFVNDPQDLTITLKLNGETMQNESTADMIFTVTRLIEFISSYVKLLPGDLICTGSPAGNGMHYKRFLKEGDVLEGSITGPDGLNLGTQRNLCKLEIL
jgi:2,4-didehydro-3-deoxy-L-rhamnonate hydrolase